MMGIYDDSFTVYRALVFSADCRYFYRVFGCLIVHELITCSAHAPVSLNHGGSDVSDARPP